MNKKIIAMVSVFGLVSQQHSMFRMSSVYLQKKSNLFTTLFLDRASKNVAEVRLISQTLVPQDLENGLFRLRLEEDAKISMVVDKKVADQQKDLVEDMQKEGGVVAYLPFEYSGFDFRTMSDVPFSEHLNIHNKYFNTQLALITHYSEQGRIFLLAKSDKKSPENTCELLKMSENSENSTFFNELQRNFDELLKNSQK